MGFVPINPNLNKEVFVIFKTRMIMSFIVIIFFAGVSCSTLSRSHRDPQSAGKGLFIFLGAKRVAKKSGNSLDELVKRMGVRLDDVDPLLIRQIRETGALKNPMRLFSQSFGDHPYKFESVFMKYNPNGSPMDQKSWLFLSRFLVNRLDFKDAEHVRLLFEELRKFTNKYGDTADMDDLATQLPYAFGRKYEYEIKMGALIDSVVKQHGPEIQGSGALEDFIEKAWYYSTQKIGFLFDSDQNLVLDNPFYEALLRKHFETLTSQKISLGAWNVANMFARKNKPFLLESLERTIREKLAKAVSGNYNPSHVEHVFRTDNEIRELFTIARENKQFKRFFEEIVSDFI